MSKSMRMKAGAGKLGVVGVKDGKVTVPLSMELALDERVTRTAEKVGLSKQSVMRLSIERGLDVLLAQLTTPPVAGA